MFVPRKSVYSGFKEYEFKRASITMLGYRKLNKKGRLIYKKDSYFYCICIYWYCLTRIKCILIFIHTFVYKIYYEQITDNGKQLSGIEVIKTAVYSYENLISCDYPNSRKRRSINNMPEGYDITLSFDKNNYGDTVSIIIYDEDCFSCNSTSITCIELVSVMEKLLISAVDIRSNDFAKITHVK